MTITQVKTFYRCRHDAAPQRCIIENCRNWTGLAPDDIRSIFGKQSSSILAARMARERPSEYARLRLVAMTENLIPTERIPISLRPQE
jgi:hypothetical protein